MSEDKPKPPVIFYYQVASIVLLLILVFFTIFGLWGLVKLAAPRLNATTGYGWSSVSDFDSYVESKDYREDKGLYYRRSREDTTHVVVLTREQVEAKQKAALNKELDKQRYEGAQSFFLWLVVSAVCLPLYFFHHREVKKAQRFLRSSYET